MIDVYSNGITLCRTNEEYYAIPCVMMVTQKVPAPLVRYGFLPHGAML